MGIVARRAGLALAAVVLAVSLAACQPTPTDDDSESPGDGQVTTLTPEPTEEPTTDAESPTQGGELDEASQAAVDDLAERLGVDASAITAGPLEQVTWPDGAIGCPQPGKSYTQMLEDGRRLMLTVDGEQYAYHGKGDDPLFYCENPTEPTSTESM